MEKKLELNEVLKTVLNEEGNYSDNSSSEELSDVDRVELALEMLYGISKNYKGLATTVLKVYELYSTVSEENGHYVEDEDDGDYEEEDEYGEDEEDEGSNDEYSTRTVRMNFN